MAAVAERVVALFLQQAFEDGLAALERQVARVVPVEVQQVEREIRQRVLRTFLKRGLQIGEAGASLGVEDHDLAIEDGIVDGKLGGGFGDISHAMRPVETLAGEEACVSRTGLFVDVDLDAVAVELELVQPIFPLRRLLDRRSERGRQEGGHSLVGEIVEYALAVWNLLGRGFR